MTIKADLTGNTVYADGFVGTNAMTVEGITISTGSGAPSASAPKGSLYVDVAGAELYINTNGSTTWAEIAHA